MTKNDMASHNDGGPAKTRVSGESQGVVRQRADDDCTICAIAMATGLPYERVMDAAAQSVGGYRYQGRPGTMSPKGVLIDLGFAAQRVGVEAIQPGTLRRLLWGRRAILSVQSLNGFPGHHDVYWDGERICDPTTKTPHAPNGLSDAKPIWAVLLDEADLLTRIRTERGDLATTLMSHIGSCSEEMRRAEAAEARALKAEAENKALKEGAEAAAKSFDVGRRIIESGQVVDKDLHGLLSRARDKARALLPPSESQ